MDFEIIDFHTHPFLTKEDFLCKHKDIIQMDADDTFELFKKLGISKICGSVVYVGNDKYENNLEKIRDNNRKALELRDYYKGFYIPGFHVHPHYVEESIEEIRRMNKEGVNLIGELVPYIDGWDDYGSDELSLILDEAGKYNMIVDFHTMPLGFEGIEKMVKNHPDVIFVAAHPGEYNTLMNHIEIGKKYENYYIDLSGSGLNRFATLRRLIDSLGVDRLLFGTDFPACSPSMFIGGVLFDNLVSDSEKEKIFSLNAKKLLNL